MNGQSYFQIIQAKDPRFKDVSKIRSLFSDFPTQKIHNPIQYETNLSLWKELIGDFIRNQPSGNEERGNIPWLLSRSWLMEQFLYFDPIRKGRLFPLGIDHVLSVMAEEGELLSLDSYLSGSPLLLPKPSIWSLINGLFWLTMSSSTGSKPSIVDQFVIKSQLKHATDIIFLHYQREVIHPITDRLFTLDGFITELVLPAFKSIDNTNLSRMHFNLLKGNVLDSLLEALKERGAIVINHTELRSRIIKLPDIRSQSMDNRLENQPINDIDLSIIIIKGTFNTLANQVAHIQQRMNQALKEMAHYRSQKQTQLIKVQLSKLKYTGKLLTNLKTHRNNLISVLERFQQSDTDRQVMDAYMAANKGLKQINATDQLNPEKVSQCMDELADLMAQGDDIGNILAEPISQPSNISDSELERELYELSIEINQNEPGFTLSSSNSNLPLDPKHIFEELDNLKVNDFELPHNNKTKYDQTIPSLP